MENTQQKKIQEQMLLYHLTPIQNLKGILENGLCSRAMLTSMKGVDFCDIANTEIIDKRNQLKITNFIPFHFFCKNPFDWAVLKQHSSKEFCYITITRDFAKKNQFKILTQHPLSKNAKLFDDYEEGFSHIQWDEMNKRDYSDTKCKQVCMAEALSPTPIQCKDFHLIVFQKENQEIQQLLKSKSIKFENNPNWFIHQ